MNKLLIIVGARPQFIKAAALYRTIRSHFSDQLEECLLHTGQHYDDAMSAVFFRELELKEPDINLQVGSSSHGRQTAAMISGIEEVLEKEKPDMVVVFGDTNSTLAGALAASKRHIPLAHIEAGLRSYNKTTPEELNRVLTDHMSSLLFCPTRTAVANLEKEGYVYKENKPAGIDNPRVFFSGDIMYDNALFYAGKEAGFHIEGLKNNFILCTIHREHNTDNPDFLNSILRGIMEIAEKHKMQVIIPLHPRARTAIHRHLDKDLKEKLQDDSVIRIIQPLSHLEMCGAEIAASLLITDSGGVQKEAYFYNKPVIVLREETEWIEIIETGNGILAGADSGRIIEAADKLLTKNNRNFPEVFGDGHSAEMICREIVNFLQGGKI